MARVEITEDELVAGSFPPVCAKSGEPTHHLVAMDIRLPHPMTRWLVVAGIIPYFVWRQLFAHRVAAKIPLSQALIELRRRQHALLLVAAAGGTAAAGIGTALPGGSTRAAMIVTGLVVAVGAHMVLAGWRRETTIRFTATRYGTVVVDRIHPTFRSALAAGGGGSEMTSVSSSVRPVPAPTSVPQQRQSA